MTLPSADGPQPTQRRDGAGLPPEVDYAARRRVMVEEHIEARGVRSKPVLDAMAAVPRERFLPEHLREFAYEDTPLPIGEGQTISQPYIVAFMIEALALQGGETVLEIGAGSGYAAAILSRIAGEVYTVERIGELAMRASEKLSDLGYDNVHVLHADGTQGWPDHAPYDAIIVAAGGPQIPKTLKAQLKIGGRLVIPVGTDPRGQELMRVTRISEDEYKTEDIADVRFVPLVGAEGWAPETEAPRRKPPERPDDLLAEAVVAGGGGLFLDRGRRPRAAAGAHRGRTRGAAGRGDARHRRVLPHARADHAGADRAQRFSLRRH